jgi:hypothetical protein
VDPRRRARFALPVFALYLGACGAVTGLDTPRHDAGPVVDSGSDAITIDAGLDAADAGVDATDSGTHPQDAGVDAHDAAIDAADASDGAVVDVIVPIDAPVDAPVDSGYSFTHPIQIDASSLFNVNTVATTATGGPALTPTDDSTPAADNDFGTQTKMTQLNASGIGVPDDAFFASNGSTIPNVKLAWNNAYNNLNSLLVTSIAPASHTLKIPPGSYAQLQVYAMSTEGPSTVSFSLTYADGPAPAASYVFPDWCVGSLTAPGTYVLTRADRAQYNGTNFNGDHLCSIFAFDMNPDPARTLVSLSFDVAQTTNESYFLFYGATAW